MKTLGKHEYPEIRAQLKAGGYRNYSARAAQQDLDTICGHEYTLDGDCYRGYLIRHNASGRTVVSGYAPRHLVILAIALWRSAQ
jgi:hypothetical protein